jgi:hypothetical protein
VSDVEAPPYDPAVHTLEDNPTVLVELWCACGVAHRQVDPVTHVAPQVAGFAARHSGPGHWSVPGEQALAEREARREAGFRAAGRQDEYEARTPTEPRAGFDWTALQPKADADADADERRAAADADEAAAYERRVADEREEQG